MKEYADPQLMSNLLAISVTVIHLPSSRALIRSTFSVIHEVVGQPEQSSSMMTSATLEPFHSLVHIPLHNTVSSILC